MTARARGPCASPAPAVTLAKSRAPRWPVQGGCWWPHRCRGGATGVSLAVPRATQPTVGPRRHQGAGKGQDRGIYVSPAAPAVPLPRWVLGTWMEGDCPAPGPCPHPLSHCPPPPAVQPRGVPSRRRRVSQLSSAASEQRRVLDNTPAGRGGLAGVESPRGGKKKMKKQKKNNQAGGGIRAGGGLVARRGGLQLLGLPRAHPSTPLPPGARPGKPPGAAATLLAAVPIPQRGQEVPRHLRGDLGCRTRGQHPAGARGCPAEPRVPAEGTWVPAGPAVGDARTAVKAHV